MENFVDQMLGYIFNVVLVIIGVGVLIIILVVVAGKKINKRNSDFKNY